MFRLFDYYALILGRILIGGFFLWSGILLALNLDQTTIQFASFHAGIDPVWLAIVAIVLEVAGGIAIVINWKMRYFALGLAIYFALITVAFNAALQDQNAISLFLKNTAIIGSLLYLSATSA